MQSGSNLVRFVRYQRRRHCQSLVDSKETLGRLEKAPAVHPRFRKHGRVLVTLGFIAPDTNQSNLGWFFVTRRGREAAHSHETFERGRKAAQFPATMLHEEIRGAGYDALVRGNFQQAVAEAFRLVEVKVRNASGLKGVGGELMQAAFHEDTGPLRSDAADSGERQALLHLFAGAFGWVRNPVSHRDVSIDDLTHATEQLMVANLSLRIVDERIAARRSRNP